MRRLRTSSTRRLYGLVAVVALLAATAGIAQAALGGSASAPDPKPLDRAVLDALRAPRVEGVSARVTFTNGLLPGGSMPNGGGSPLAQGAEGRLWVAGDGRFRLELQSDGGDAQIVDDGKHLTLYDPASKTAYTRRAMRGATRRGEAADARRRRPRRSSASGVRGRSPAPSRHDRRPPELHGRDRAQGRRRAARRRPAGVGRGQGRPAARRGLRAGPGRAGDRARGERRLVRRDLRLDAVGRTSRRARRSSALDPPARRPGPGRPGVRGATPCAGAARLPARGARPNWPACRAPACGSCASASAPARSARTARA